MDGRKFLFAIWWSNKKNGSKGKNTSIYISTIDWLKKTNNLNETEWRFSCLKPNNNIIIIIRSI